VGTIDTDDLGFAVNIGQDGTGHYTDGGSSSLDALIDDVAIWRRVVTPDEAGKIFLRGQSGQDLLGNGGHVDSPVTFTASTITGNTIALTWQGAGTFQLQKKAALTDATWTNVGAPTSAGTVTDTVGTSGNAFYRLSSQ
jgi:hypothetical protein